MPFHGFQIIQKERRLDAQGTAFLEYWQKKDFLNPVINWVNPWLRSAPTVKSFFSTQKSNTGFICSLATRLQQKCFFNPENSNTEFSRGSQARLLQKRCLQPQTPKNETLGSIVPWKRALLPKLFFQPKNQTLIWTVAKKRVYSKKVFLNWKIKYCVESRCSEARLLQKRLFFNPENETKA